MPNLGQKLLPTLTSTQDFETSPELHQETQIQRRNKKGTQVHGYTSKKVFYSF